MSHYTYPPYLKNLLISLHDVIFRKSDFATLRQVALAKKMQAKIRTYVRIFALFCHRF